MTNTLKLLPNSKFLQTSLIYSLVVGVMAGFRVSFVFLLSVFGGFDDVSKFFLYGALTIASDTLSIFGSYISSNFLGKRISCILGFTLIIIGNILLFFSILFHNQILLYSTLCYVSLGIGILKCNLFVIANLHLQTEFLENKNDFGSIMHTWSVFCSFLMIFLSGILISNFKILIPLISVLIFSMTFIFFIFLERSYIKIALSKIIFSKSQNIKFIFIFIFLSVFLFLFFFYSGNVIVRNLPITIFALFLIYLLRRALKNRQEREYIFLAIIFSFFLIIYLGFERQRDTTFALFLARNVELDLFKNFKFLAGKFVLTPIQLNSFFPVFILFIGFILFKFKIHSKLKTKYNFLIVNFGLFISFGILFLQTKMSLMTNVSSNFIPLLSPIFYIISMFSMSFCNVLVYSKFIEICRIMPPLLNQIISSFMIVSVATGFFLARFFNQFMIVEHKKNAFDLIQSLEIYSQGFLKLTIISLCFIVFWIFALMIKSFRNILEKEY